MLFLLTFLPGSAREPSPKGACLVCHKLRTPELYTDWLGSAHARHNVTCLDCHEAAAGEPDAFSHGGALIATLVTPTDCAGCHQVESGQYARSAHARSAVDPGRPGDWGKPGSCAACHGGTRLLDAAAPNKLLSTAWPDRGTGRVNPDGSRGSCAACHADHAFKPELARLDETCRVCHSRGHEAVHVAGGDSRAPSLEKETRSCADCHLTAGGRSLTHDPATRRGR
ncbi:MAG: hypothetical protein WC326_05185 [Candidatus Delongbacteria bacterium]